MKKEDYFIGLFESKSTGIGDDGVLKDGLIYSKDAFFENVHFKREWCSLKAIAKKAMLVNISDAVAMNAKPLYALLSVAMPSSISPDEMRQIAEGIKEAADEYGMVIIGGDTIANVKLDFSVTVVSKPQNKITYRKGLRVGHELAYTGNLGSVAKELKKALRGHKPRSSSKLITPVLKSNFFYAAAKQVSVAIDISDGLFFELERLSKINRVGFRFFEPIPKQVGCSGEEYEMLFAYDKQHRLKIKALAKKYRTQITPIGTVVRGTYKHSCKEHHF